MTYIQTFTILCDLVYQYLFSLSSFAFQLYKHLPFFAITLFASSLSSYVLKICMFILPHRAHYFSHDAHYLIAA